MLKSRLFVYPSPGTALTEADAAGSSNGQGTALAEGGVMLEFASAKRRDECIDSLQSRGILAARGAVAPRRRGSWTAFLSSIERGPRFDARAFLLGPFWYFQAGLQNKQMLMAAYALGLRGSLALSLGMIGLAPALPAFVALRVDLPPVGIPVSWGPVEQLACMLYAGFYGEYHLFLARVPGKAWHESRSETGGLRSSLVALACLAVWALGMVEVDRLVGEGGRMVATFPLWVDLLNRLK